MYKVLGYYVHKDDKVLNALTAMVVIDVGSSERLGCYCGAEQHSDMDRGYFSECIPITKEQYIEANKGYYTPSEYLN